MNKTAIYSVTQISNRLNHSLEQKFSNIFVKGEISTFRLYDSGHAYFTLKDQSSILNCVYFNYVQEKDYLSLNENLEITVFGNINIYKTRGTIQFIVTKVHIGQEGELWQKYLRLKNKLKDEGLFEKKYKKKLPYFPSEITIISSNKGAVIHDILNILYRRAPYLNINIKHSIVQGENARYSISDSIVDVNKEKKNDIIILARGGGSLEDLKPFNDELVVREIFKSKIPIITAIGHDSDLTLSDLVSDVSVATPSEAAELCAPNITSLYHEINLFEGKVLFRLENLLKEKNNFLDTYYLRILSKNPKLNIEYFNENLNLNYRILKNSLIDKLKNYKNKLKKNETIIRKYDAEHLKSRGFSIVKRKNKILKSINSINIGDDIDIDLRDGQIKARINKIYVKKNKK